jgi:hypothetical protein
MANDLTKQQREDREKAMASCDQTIAALRLDNAQKAERIAELEGGKK